MADRKKIAVLGAGTMGAGMAVQYALYGHEVMLYSRTQATLERAAKIADKSCNLLAVEGLFSKEDADKALSACKDAYIIGEIVKGSGVQLW